MAISITFNNVDIKQGSAAEFRNLINTNFNNVKSAFTQVGSEFDKVYSTMNGEFNKVSKFCRRTLFNIYVIKGYTYRHLHFTPFYLYQKPCG